MKQAHAQSSVAVKRCMAPWRCANSGEDEESCVPQVVQTTTEHSNPHPFLSERAPLQETMRRLLDTAHAAHVECRIQQQHGNLLFHSLHLLEPRLAAVIAAQE